MFGDFIKMLAQFQEAQTPKLFISAMNSYITSHRQGYAKSIKCTESILFSSIIVLVHHTLEQTLWYMFSQIGIICLDTACKIWAMLYTVFALPLHTCKSLVLCLSTNVYRTTATFFPHHSRHCIHLSFSFKMSKLHYQILGHYRPIA